MGAHELAKSLERFTKVGKVFGAMLGADGFTAGKNKGTIAREYTALDTRHFPPFRVVPLCDLTFKVFKT